MTSDAAPARSWVAPVDLVVGRIVGCGLLAWMSWIHLHLWSDGYRHLHIVGPLFLLNFIAGVLVALAVLGAPLRWLGPSALIAAVLAAGTLAALSISINMGLFGYKEYLADNFVHLSIWVESSAIVVLGAVAGRAASVAVRSRSRSGLRSAPTASA
jgi:hypothetical protein